MSTLNVAIIQTELDWHAPAANRDRFATRIDALEAACDLIVLPEMFTTGFSMDAAGMAETMGGPSLQWLAAQAEKANAAICGSLIIKDGDSYHNRFVLMQPDGSVAHYDKRHLFQLAGEGDHYQAGSALPTFSVAGWRLRPMVCYDLRFPLWSRRREDDDFDLLVYVANWPQPRQHAWDTLLQARAIENQCYVVGVNRIGEDGNGLPYTGGSSLINYLGENIVDLGNSDQSASATLELAPLQAFREKFPFAADADRFTMDI